MGRVKMDQTKRFWAGVDTTGECWLWQKGLFNTGYGAFRATDPVRKMMTAHKFSYELVNDEVPRGMVIDHICHEPRCVRPEHLRVVTIKQNLEHKLTTSKTARSGIRGVSWNSLLKKWQAQVRHNGTLHIAGYYETVDGAAVAVREMRNQLHTHNTFDRTTP